MKYTNPIDTITIFRENPKIRNKISSLAQKISELYANYPNLLAIEYSHVHDSNGQAKSWYSYLGNLVTLYEPKYGNMAHVTKSLAHKNLYEMSWFYFENQVQVTGYSTKDLSKGFPVDKTLISSCLVDLAEYNLGVVIIGRKTVENNQVLVEYPTEFGVKFKPIFREKVSGREDLFPIVWYGEDLTPAVFCGSYAWKQNKPIF